MTVAIVSTGGTIASTPERGGDATPELTGDDLITAVPELASIASLETYDFSNVPSPQFSVGQMYELTQLLAELDADSDVEGVVVTQGTDVLEESAYFADLCYDGTTPVTFTGAMRNPSLPSSDGSGNLVTAVRTVTDDRARSTGVLVSFNYRVYPARDAVKANSMNPDTFRSPEFGPLAVLDENRLEWHRRSVELDEHFEPDPDALTNEVSAITATVDMSPAQLHACHGQAAVCLAATGAGHIPPTIIPALEELRDEGVPLVATTRCHEGRLARNTYGFRGSERTLQELGCYYSDRALSKTRIRTIVALAADELDAAFQRPGGE